MEPRENYDLITVIQICIGKESTQDHSMLEMLRVIFSTVMRTAEKKKILSRDYKMDMETETGKEIEDMCNFADLIEEQALEKGEAVKLITLVCRKLAKGKTSEMIAEDLEENIEEIRRICGIADKYAPDYDVDKIFVELDANK